MNYKSLLLSVAGAFTLAQAAFATVPYDIKQGETITYKGTDLVAKTDNLLENGSFDNGTTGWMNGLEQELGSNWEVKATGGADGGAYLYTASGSNGGSGTAGALRLYKELTPGKTYYFSAFSMNAGDFSRLCTNSSATTAGATDHVCDFTGGSEWKQNDVVFTATESSRFAVIQCGWLGAGAAFDCVNLVEVDEPELPKLVEENVPYYLYNEKSGAYLSVNAEWTSLQEFGADGYEQAFMFMPVAEGAAADGYNIGTPSGTYIYNDGANKWNTNSGKDVNLNSVNAIFMVDGEPGLVTLRVMSSSYLGADNFSAGTSVYCDKSGSSVIEFRLIEATDMEVVYDALETAIDEAYGMTEDADEGNEAGQYPQEAFDALMEAIALAEEALEAETQKEVNEALAALRAAMEEFSASKIIIALDVKHGIYRLAHAESGAYFYTGWHDDASCAIYIGGDFRTDYKGEFEIEATADNAYTLLSADGYLTTNGTSLTFSSTLPSGNNGKFAFHNNGTGTTITSLATGAFVGPQWGSYYSWVHAVADHNGANGQHNFKLELVKDLSETSGIENVAAAADITVSAAAGVITVDGAEAAALYTVAGTLVATGEGSHISFEAAAGTYIVKAGATARVVIVK